MKANLPRFHLILVLAIPMMQICSTFVSADEKNKRGSFQVRIESLSNPNSILANGSCCVNLGGNTDVVRTACIEDGCTTWVDICWKVYQSKIKPGDCSFGKKQVRVYTNTNNLIVKLPFSFRWPGGFSLIVTALHNDGRPSYPGAASSLILQHSFQSEADARTGWIEKRSSGINGLRLRYSYRLECSQGFYGKDCDTYCIPRDDEFGHHQCTSIGEKVCLPGWEGSYCDKAICKHGCSGGCKKPGECECPIGWAGPNCDQCQTAPGCMHGTCEKPNECNCKPGYVGELCSIDNQRCTKERGLCAEGATCVNDGNSEGYKCLCPPGRTGKHCREELVGCTVRGKPGHQCQNNGKCLVKDGFASCECVDPFKGAFCQFDSSLCVKNIPCLNGGTCNVVDNRAICQCPFGYSGPYCQDSDSSNSCFKSQSSPCLNGGSCINTMEGYKCECAPHHFGSNCQYESCDRGRRDCGHHGRCIDSSNGPICQCDQFHFGPICQHVSLCHKLLPCRHGGSCSNQADGSYRCRCTSNHYGKNCENKTACASSPCPGGSTCLPNGASSYKCICPEGKTGDNCVDAYDYTTLIIILAFLLIPMVLIIIAIFVVCRRISIHKQQLRAATAAAAASSTGCNSERTENVVNSIYNQLQLQDNLGYTNSTGSPEAAKPPPFAATTTATRAAPFLTSINSSTVAASSAWAPPPRRCDCCFCKSHRDNNVTPATGSVSDYCKNCQIPKSKLNNDKSTCSSVKINNCQRLTCDLNIDSDNDWFSSSNLCGTCTQHFSKINSSSPPANMAATITSCRSHAANCHNCGAATSVESSIPHPVITQPCPLHVQQGPNNSCRHCRSSRVNPSVGVSSSSSSSNSSNGAKIDLESQNCRNLAQPLVNDSHSNQLYCDYLKIPSDYLNKSSDNRLQNSSAYNLDASKPTADKLLNTTCKSSSSAASSAYTPNIRDSCISNLHVSREWLHDSNSATNVDVYCANAKGSELQSPTAVSNSCDLNLSKVVKDTVSPHPAAAAPLRLNDLSSHNESSAYGSISAYPSGDDSDRACSKLYPPSSDEALVSRNLGLSPKSCYPSRPASTRPSTLSSATNITYESRNIDNADSGYLGPKPSPGENAKVINNSSDLRHHQFSVFTSFSSSLPTTSSDSSSSLLLQSQSSLNASREQLLTSSSSTSPADDNNLGLPVIKRPPAAHSSAANEVAVGDRSTQIHEDRREELLNELLDREERLKREGADHLLDSSGDKRIYQAEFHSIDV